MTKRRREALMWADHVPLVRCSDGLWRGMGAKAGDDYFSQDDVRLLAKMGLLELMPIGAIITDDGRAALKQAAHFRRGIEQGE